MRVGLEVVVVVEGRLCSENFSVWTLCLEQMCEPGLSTKNTCPPPERRAATQPLAARKSLYFFLLPARQEGLYCLFVLLIVGH